VAPQHREEAQVVLGQKNPPGQKEGVNPGGKLIMPRRTNGQKKHALKRRGNPLKWEKPEKPAPFFRHLKENSGPSNARITQQRVFRPSPFGTKTPKSEVPQKPRPPNWPHKNPFGGVLEPSHQKKKRGPTGKKPGFLSCGHVWGQQKATVNPRFPPGVGAPKGR